MQKANKKLFEVSKIDNFKLLVDVQEASKAENQKQQASILSINEKELKATSGKLQEIHESVSKRITGVEERVSHLEKLFHASQLQGQLQRLNGGVTA